MPIHGMLRVKNEERFLQRCLDSIIQVCDGGIYLMDDHSTDTTPYIASGFGCKVFDSPFHADELNEARDKTWLLERICEDVPEPSFGAQSPHWVFGIDGDEELVVEDQAKFRPSELGNVVDHWSVQILYLWDSPNAVRWDGMYAKCYRPSIFRLLDRGMKFNNHSGNLHPSSVPTSHISCDPRVHEPEPIRLLHYGYLDKRDREKKFDWYMARDGVQEDFYRRECFGPATLKPLSDVLR